MGMGLAMWLSFLFLVSWVPAHIKRRIVGYGFISDITVHIVLQSLFGGDSAGRAGMLFAGILINVTMHVYRYMLGYEKLRGGKWVRFTGLVRTRS